MLLGIVNPWPTEISAESEFTARLIWTLKSKGHTTFVVDPYGKILSTSPDSSSITLLDADAFFIFDPRSIHFECKAPLISPVWVPPELLSLEGRMHFLDSVKRIDFFIGGYGSEKLIKIYNQALARSNRKLENLVPFCASVPVSFAIEPQSLKTRNLFYAGVNSERIFHTNGRVEARPGRHHDLFKLLDSHPNVHFYGPRKYSGIEPWTGFSNYKGDIPLDGRSVIEKISQCGIALCISSLAHLNYGLVSNRVFEAAAAGAVIISDENEFVKRHFGDSVYYIDTRDQQTAFRQITQIIDAINADPDAALCRAHQSHRIFREQLSLDLFCDILCQKVSEIKKPDPGLPIAIVTDNADCLESACRFGKTMGIRQIALIGQPPLSDPLLSGTVEHFPTYEAFIEAASHQKISYFIGFTEQMTVKPHYLLRLLECAKAQSPDCLILASLEEFDDYLVPEIEKHILKIYFSGLQNMAILNIISHIFSPGSALIPVTRTTTGNTSTYKSSSYREWLYNYLAVTGLKGIETIKCAGHVFKSPHKDESNLNKKAKDMEWLYERGLGHTPSPELAGAAIPLFLTQSMFESNQAAFKQNIFEQLGQLNSRLRHYDYVIRILSKIRHMVRRIKATLKNTPQK